MSGEAENLDARMEAIRLKNEELEKKHREIREDEILAKEKGAIVDLKNASPVTPHPYDNVELDFDVKETEKELAKKSDHKPKNRRPILRKELDEIPPDPVNFLREDGDQQDQTPRPPGNKHNQRNNSNNNNRNRRDRPQQSNKEGSDNASTGDSPTHAARNRNQRPKPPPQEGGNASPKKVLHPQQLRNERRSAPQNDVPQSRPSGGPQQQQQQNRQRRPQNNRPPPNKETTGTAGSNITVEVKDGEVRSVKLKQEKTFGSGRVRTENMDSFTVDTFDPNNVDGGERRSQKNNERSPQDKTRNRNPRNNRKPQNKPGQKEFQHPTLENLVVPKANVQDRLMRIAKDAPESAPEPTPTAEGN